MSTQIVEWLDALVSFDTQNPPGRESQAVAWLARTLETFGCKVWTEEALPGRPNVVAELGNGDGKTLAFNSHVDVVPVGGGWAGDPFKLREDGGRFYGRGACDAKGAIAAMLDAVRTLCTDRRGWRGTLRAVFVADEETESRGAKAYAKTSPHIDYAVIGEPTSNGIVTAHKGSLRPIVAVTGVAAHSGTPELGVNAIYGAAKLCELVEREHVEVISRRRHPLCGAAAMSVTRIHGGHADNIIPERCELMIDRRMIPGEDEETVKREIAQLLERSGVRAEIIAWQPTTGGPTETEVSQPIVQVALRAAAAHGVARPGPAGFQGGCDLVHFRKTGAQGVILGPGTLAVAHKPDEFVPAEELFVASLIYRDIALAMLQ